MGIGQMGRNHRVKQPAIAPRNIAWCCSQLYLGPRILDPPVLAGSTVHPQLHKHECEIWWPCWTEPSKNKILGHWVSCWIATFRSSPSAACLPCFMAVPGSDCVEWAAARGGFQYHEIMKAYNFAASVLFSPHGAQVSASCVLPPAQGPPLPTAAPSQLNI